MHTPTTPLGTINTLFELIAKEKNENKIKTVDIVNYIGAGNCGT